MNTRNSLRSALGATVLASILCLTACTPPAWFLTAEGIAEAAVPIAGSIVDIVDPTLAPGVTVLENAFSALDNAMKTYQAQPTASNLQVVEAAFAAVQKNETQLEAAARIKNPATDTKINGVISLIGTAITEIAALIPPQAPVSATMLAMSSQARAKAQGMTRYDFEKDFNSLVKGDPRFKGKMFHIPLMHRL